MEMNLALMLLLVVGVLWLVHRAESPQKRIAQRVRQVAARTAAEVQVGASASVQPVSQRVKRRIALLGELVPILDAEQRTKVAQRLISAGFRDRRAVSVLAGLKLLVGVGFALGMIVGASHVPRIGEYFVFRALMMAGAFMIGMMLPEFVLDLMIRQRQKRIAAYLPDALDLLVICTNAGNSLVVAIKRVASELKMICPPLADEFAVTADELQIGGDISSALNALAKRIAVPSTRALVTTLVQSQQYGTPITQSLRQLSRTERSMQIVALEEKAAKLAPKMSLPMLLFIMPTVALIAAGPAIIRLIALFPK
ncbi:type II secretion system F family protein (plasmid) [Burkholderia humptydooensis]|uniref:Type II secretion system F family protein n=2 Tax=Burkholderia humptydooensis TaxID=430531 RepID=A0A7U4SU87_9BURK|nr:MULTISPECIES: type II secretion system F family protein [Burkholderia]AJY38097.1 type II secretion system (T2SS), F family protein [Burkholderia sp. 2002721687]ALX44582.1 fimbrial protein [Burkholderia humptydooensis]EIP84998.1 Bacterial type II secretion system protein [Burkholderia humptydooensis MSMB43]QPS42033.1 type II secretion system F family protein [Burkholderia humptydooensis]